MASIINQLIQLNSYWLFPIFQATTDTTARGPLMPSPGMVTTDVGTVMDTAMGTATATATDTTDEAAQEVHVFQSD